ncbi:centrosome and spindle pole-associated protein 1 [Micropterus salmoides]|uniref:centrosome and spindle pole-associated protein 1 n=1 Tax=Micropterus salmoides TaxID=27706 RepID=UPI0018EBCB5B|nr:centrosome and spindle pole-associated protein 1 [Micropterus salmoides]
MPPASATQGMTPYPDRGLGFNLLLGTEYERKKKKLQQELQLDYKNYVAKKNSLKTSEPRLQTQGLSLPIDEKISVQEKLREERKKEYNLFLQDQVQIRRVKRRPAPVTSKPGQIQASDAGCISCPASPLPVLSTHTNILPPPRERAVSRRDAATLTEAVDNGQSTRTWGLGQRGRRRWQLYGPKQQYSSDEELITDKEEELELRHRRRQDSHTPVPEYKEERRTRERRANRAHQDKKEVEAPGVLDQNNNEWVWKSDPQMLDSMRTAAKSRPATSKDKTEFATGLMIASQVTVREERAASQMRKEQYKQELLKQIAEQQRNKIREKQLELRVAATGATDPEKEPDRIKQFGAGSRHYGRWKRDVPYKPGIDLEAVGKDPNPRPKDDKPTEATERRAPPGKSHVDYSTAVSQVTGKTVPAQGVPSLDYINEDYHRDFSNMLGKVAVPRVADGPPPVPPTVDNNYKTPYDAAYYYYGTRNPLDPNLPYNQNGVPGGVQQSGNFHIPPQRPPALRPSGRTESILPSLFLASDQHRASPLVAGELSADKTKRRESALSYQEALRQQIKEREERKRREKEEKEQYDAKIEAEMMEYNPWGRSGGGAPIKDQKGNLVSDLNQMHRINEESYRNPVSRNSVQTHSLLRRNEHSPGAEARPPLSHRLSGFTEQLTPQQLHMQGKYKEALKQQIEENKRKQEEERERMRCEEEKEEKRLEDQRARIQREYEEEQRKQKKAVHRQEDQSWNHEPKTQHQEVERRVRPEQDIEKKAPESVRGREEKRAQLSYEREPSPPIPTLQKKQTIVVVSRPSSGVSQLSSRTERSVSAPHYRTVPVKIPQLQDGQQEVFRELSALRRYLRKEQRQLEVQLGQTDRQESHYTPPRPRGRPRADAFDSMHKRAVQPSTRSPSPGAAHVNMQNIREFSQLKYKDTASREEVRRMYPDVPTDAQSLDIQQQALLREQQRKIRLLNREEEHDFLDQQLSHYRSRNKPGCYIHRDSTLPSETAFIDVYSGDACEEQVHQQRPPQSSAEQRERSAPRRRHDYDVAVSRDQRGRNIQPDALQPVTSSILESKLRAHDQHRITRQDLSTGDHNSRSEGLSGDEVDVLSLYSALERRVSVETVATEPWLRPGTSDAVKRSDSREKPNSRMDAPPRLTHCIT